ncbi:MAG: virulence factor Mce family protein [Flammeovirgaceae bacterium]|nr:virulence factor Mce family protein [Flammeovirgaceae bacterium]PDH44954.1 MAG: virulence factor Mce family protein [Rhodothermaeota bacterium MED-G18]|tara:strand:+ start:3267 stop:4217 length:951 start_codon:yes stop_codon:yes gene_type:complete
MNKEIKVGLIGIIGLVLFYLGSNFLKGIDFFSPINRYYALYENVDGLIVANPVIVNGYSVGRVSEIRILQERENKILVSMDIDKDLIIGRSSKATLSSNDFLGSKAIVLSIGDINSPISEGDTIMSEIAGGLSELLEKATPITDNLGVTISRLNDILASLRGSGDMITTTLDNLNNVLTNTNNLIDSNEETISSTLENLNNLTDDLSDKLNDIDPIIKGANDMISNLSSVDFENTFNQIDILLSSANGIFDDIESGDGGTLSLLLSDDSLYNNLNKTAFDLDKLLQHINENPKHFFAPLGKSRKKIERDLRKQEKD